MDNEERCERHMPDVEFYIRKKNKVRIANSSINVGKSHGFRT